MTLSNVRMLVVTTFAMVLASFGGCNQTPRTARNAIMEYQVGDYAQAAALLKPSTLKKDENFVLNNCRYGSCALAAGDLDGAENAFLAAYEVINGVNTNDGGRTLGATMVFEGVKVWKGEPFERAMAHYYLGMIYLLKNDYGNARAAFQNSLFKVREYASKDDLDHYKEAESSFALGYFGLGYTNLKMGKPDLAAANFKLAQQNDPRLAQVIADVQRPGVNTLIFVDAGQGPRRAPKGWYNEESAFGPTPPEAGPIPPIQAWLDTQPASRPNEQYHVVDTLAMAQQQRWQDIDTIRKTKAVIGTGLMAGGAGAAAYGAQANNRTAEYAGLGAMVAGIALAASSQADLRYWEMLPRTVYIVPATITPGTHEILVEAGPSRSMPLSVTLAPPSPGSPGDHVYYFRLR